MTLQELLEEPERAFLKPDDKNVMRYQEMREAHKAIANLVHSRYCEGCGKKANTEGHHPVYGQEFRETVIWLCKTCHSKVTGRITRRKNEKIQIN